MSELATGPSSTVKTERQGRQRTVPAVDAENLIVGASPRAAAASSSARSSGVIRKTAAKGAAAAPSSCSSAVTCSGGAAIGGDAAPGGRSAEAVRQLRAFLQNNDLLSPMHTDDVDRLWRTIQLWARALSALSTSALRVLRATASRVHEPTATHGTPKDTQGQRTCAARHTVCRHAVRTSTGCTSGHLRLPQMDAVSARTSSFQGEGSRVFLQRAAPASAHRSGIRGSRCRVSAAAPKDLGMSGRIAELKNGKVSFLPETGARTGHQRCQVVAFANLVAARSGYRTAAVSWRGLV